MICVQCKQQDKRSKVYPGQSFTTLMAANPYYDEEGVYRSNDPNVTTVDYECSNLHRFRIEAGPGDEMTRTELEPEREPDVPEGREVFWWDKSVLDTCGVLYPGQEKKTLRSREGASE